MQITHTQRCTRTITKSEGWAWVCSSAPRVGLLSGVLPRLPLLLLPALLGCNSSGSLSAKLEHLAHNSKYIKTTHIRSEEQKLSTRNTSTGHTSLGLGCFRMRNQNSFQLSRICNLFRVPQPASPLTKQQQAIIAFILLSNSQSRKNP